MGISHLSSALAHRASLPNPYFSSILNLYLNSPSPSQAEPLWWWRDRFRSFGPFWAAVDVTITPIDDDQTIDQATLERVLPLQFAPPATLYRGASERGTDGLSWTTQYAVAQRVANSRGPHCSVWKTTAATVYGCIDVRRIYLGMDGAIEEFTIWLIDPGPVELVNRWADPNDPANKAPEWADRGVTKAEAEALIEAWCTLNPNDQSAAENFGRDFWRDKLASIGQFTGALEKKKGLSLAPTRNLKPTSTLYRAAIDDYKDGLAWTTELHAVHRYNGWRGEHSRIWTADAGEVFGRIYWHGSEMGGPYWEWLIDPINIRPYEP